jgi:hypothetical protein
MISTYLGCGALPVTADTFALYVNGVDYSDPTKNTAGASIEVPTLTVATSIASNATADFTIYDPNRLVTLGAWSDVLVWWKPAGGERVLFSGLVVAQTIRQVGIGREITVRCTDYGILLDNTFSRSVVATDADPSLFSVQTACGLGLPAPIFALGGSYVSGDVRIQGRYDATYVIGYQGDAVTDTLSGDLRSVLDAIASRCVTFDPAYTPVPIAYYVDPLRRLNFWTFTSETAPVALTDAAGGTAPENLELEYDYTAQETASQVGGTTTFAMVGNRSGSNGYALGWVSVTITGAESYARIVAANRQRSSPLLRASFTIETTGDWHIGQIVTITSAAHGLASATFLVSSVDWTFASGAVATAVVGITQASLPVAGASAMRTTQKRLTKAGV